MVQRGRLWRRSTSAGIPLLLQLWQHQLLLGCLLCLPQMLLGGRLLLPHRLLHLLPLLAGCGQGRVLLHLLHAKSSEYAGGVSRRRGCHLCTGRPVRLQLWLLLVGSPVQCRRRECSASGAAQQAVS